MTLVTETGESSSAFVERSQSSSSTQDSGESVPLETLSPSSTKVDSDDNWWTDDGFHEVDEFAKQVRVEPGSLTGGSISSNLADVGEGDSPGANDFDDMEVRNPFGYPFASQLSTAMTEVHEPQTRKMEKRLPETAETLEQQGHRQGENPQQILDAGGIALTNDVADIRRYVLQRERRELREVIDQPITQLRSRPTQGDVDVEGGEPVEQRLEVCSTCAKYGFATLWAGIILAISVIAIAVSPFLFVKMFSEEAIMLRDIFSDNDHGLWFLVAMAFPAFAGALVTYIAILGLSAHGWSHRGVEPKKTADFIRLATWGIIFAFSFYASSCASIYLATIYLIEERV